MLRLRVCCCGRRPAVRRSRRSLVLRAHRVLTGSSNTSRRRSKPWRRSTALLLCSGDTATGRSTLTRTFGCGWAARSAAVRRGPFDRHRDHFVASEENEAKDAADDAIFGGDAFLRR